MSSGNNPFACLFRSTSQVENEIKSKIEVQLADENVKKISNALERIFLFTIDNGL